MGLNEFARISSNLSSEDLNSGISYFVKKIFKEQDEKVVIRDLKIMTKDEMMKVLLSYKYEIIRIVNITAKDDEMLNSIIKDKSEIEIIEYHLRPVISMAKGLSYGFAMNYESHSAVKFINDTLLYKKSKYEK